MVIPVITATTMEDTTDIHTATDIMLLERGLLKLNLKLLLPPRLRPNPGTDTMVDTMDILTVMDTTDILTDMAVTGGRFLSLPEVLPFLKSLIELSITKTCPPCLNNYLLPEKLFLILYFSKFTKARIQLA